MALSWSMDKIGPMCRSAEDCALVLDALNGRDQRDPSTFDAAFNWDAQADLSSIRLGYLPDLSERDLPALHIFRSLGVKLTEIKPFEHDAAELNFILATESAAAFDRLVRDDADQSMRPEPERSNWPDVFRLHRFVPAVEYIQANRLRTRLIEQFARVFDGLDAYIGSNLGVTNLTGNPEITFPNGFDEGRPTALSLTGQLFGEQHLVRLAQAFQSRTAFHQQRPPL
jgi:Asp-tRNA(Asn)/Glu-tRNA(Gln) amidotransferase A subunit family amidase